MNSKIDEILDELYEYDSSFKNEENKIKEIVSKMIEVKPNIKINENFKIKLKNKIMSEIKNTKKESIKVVYNNNFIKIIWSFISWGAIVAAFMFALNPTLKNIDQNAPSEMMMEWFIKPSQEEIELSNVPESKRVLKTMTMMSEEPLESSEMMMDSNNEDFKILSDDIIEPLTLDMPMDSDSILPYQDKYSYQYSYKWDINLSDYDNSPYYVFKTVWDEYPKFYSKVEVLNMEKTIKTEDDITNEISKMDTEWNSESKKIEIELSNPKLVYNEIYKVDWVYFIPALEFSFDDSIEVPTDSYITRKVVINLIDLD